MTLSQQLQLYLKKKGLDHSLFECELALIKWTRSFFFGEVNIRELKEDPPVQQEFIQYVAGCEFNCKPEGAR